MLSLLKLYFFSLNFTPWRYFLVRQVHVLHFHVRHFHVLQFHALQIGPSFSRPAISRPAHWSVNFMSCNRSNKKLSYRRETARQLPTWRGARPSNPLPRRPLWLHLCVWSNPKPATNIHQACRPLSAL